MASTWRPGQACLMSHVHSDLSPGGAACSCRWKGCSRYSTWAGWEARLGGQNRKGPSGCHPSFTLWREARARSSRVTCPGFLGRGPASLKLQGTGPVSGRAAQAPVSRLADQLCPGSRLSRPERLQLLGWGPGLWGTWTKLPVPLTLPSTGLKEQLPVYPRTAPDDTLPIGTCLCRTQTNQLIPSS